MTRGTRSTKQRSATGAAAPTVPRSSRTTERYDVKDDVTEKGTTQSTSESENPAIPSPKPEASNRPRTNRDWWPNQPDLQVLNRTAPESDPLGADFDYKKAFEGLDVEALKRDLVEVMHTSQDWWPADYGHYGPPFVPMEGAHRRPHR